jgi:hypothetical protein
MYTHNSRPILTLKDKYKSDKKLSIQKEVLNETSFNGVGLGEIKNHIDSTEEKK